MKDFIIQHWRALLVLFVALVDLITVIISYHKLTKKGMIKDSDIIAFLGEILPGLIKQAECLKGGETKMALVLNSALNRVQEVYGLRLDDSWKTRIVNLVETFLSTPQKKEKDLCQESEKNLPEKDEQ